MASRDEHADKVDLLSAIGWDLRGLGESQVRTLTAIQRCIEDYRKTADVEALGSIRSHVDTLNRRSLEHVQEALRLLLEAVETLERHTAN